MIGRKGFTIIELLIVTVVVAILVAIAVPRFSSTKVKAFDSAAKGDLRNAMSAQEAYFADRLSYGAVAGLRLTTSTGIVLIGQGSARGYGMSSRHVRSTRTFRIEVGSGTSNDGKIR